MTGAEFSPHSLRAEMHLLGAIMLLGREADRENEAMEWAVKQLRSSDFYDQRNKTIFHLMGKLYQENNPIDRLTIYHELVAAKAYSVKNDLGDEYLTALVTCVENPFNYRYCGQWVKRLSEQRQAIIGRIRAVQEAVEGKGSKRKAIYERADSGIDGL